MIGSIPRVESGSIAIEKANKKKKWKGQITSKINHILIAQGWLFYITGFLLGRAVILSTVSPFAVAFAATMWLVHRDKSFRSMIAVVLGALTYSMQHALFILLAFLLFIFISAAAKPIKNQHIVLPVIVLFAASLPRMFLYSIQDTISSFQWMMLAVEGVLAAILVLIFMQSLPLLSPKRYKPALKNEEIICFIILIASVLTGFIGWQIYGASLEQVFSRYFVLVFAFIGGAAIGSTVGVVAGLILSLANVANLYQMSLLAFSGVLGGLLKEGKKAGTALGLLIGTGLIGVYGENVALLPSLMESLMAIILFLLTPSSWFEQIARYIPGTDAYTNEQEQYSQKVRNVTAKRVEQFSDVFQALSKSFAVTDLTLSDEKREERRDTDYFLSQVTEKTCQGCFLKSKCWQKEFDRTYSFMEEMKHDITNGQEPNRTVMKDFENHCVKSRQVVEAMHAEMGFYEANQQLRQQVTESKRLVSDQLQGVSEVMNDFAKEILKERQHHELQESQIMQSLKQMGIELVRLDIYHLEKGNVDIELTTSFYEYHGEGEKLIAPILSELLDEMIVVKQADISSFPHGYSHFVFGSAKEFAIETGAANAAKGGGLVSGDSFATIELGAGKFAIAISDGMGNGKRAQEESTETLRLLQQILQTGIREKVAIKTINSILALRTTDEMFATLDLAVIDLDDAFAQFLKIGSAPSFVRRGNTMIKVEASNLPMGIIQEFDVDIVSEQLKPNDLLIMMSDGIFDGPKNVENIDMWIKRKVKEMDTEEPQEIADLLLEEVIRTRSGEINDDMTVLVAKVKKNTPKWANVPVQKGKLVSMP